MLRRTVLFLLLLPSLCFSWTRFYFAPDFYYYKFSQKSSGIFNVDESGYLTRYRIGVDSMNPFSLYYGLEISRVDAKVKHINDLLSLRTKAKNSVSNYEGRLGMCLALGQRFYFVPLFALGYHFWTRTTKEIEDSKYRYAWTYKGYGFRSYFFVNDVFDFGVFFKIMQPSKVDLKVDCNSNIDALTVCISYLHGKWPKLKLKNKLQYELQVPLYFHLPRFRLIDIGLVPYFKNMDLGESDRKDSNNAEYFYAGSREYNIGLRIEIGLNL